MNDPADAIRQAVEIESVIQDYVPIEPDQSGRYWAICPFHSGDTDPSFCVTPSMGIYKCFGCGVGGDVFDFLMEYHGWTFTDALDHLAEQAGIEYQQSSTESKEPSERQLVLRANEWAARQFRSAFEDSNAQKYMLDRGFDPDTLETFEVGYAPGDYLVQKIENAPVDQSVLQTAGLIETDESKYDFFRNRVVFPIRNSAGRTIGFGGRTLDETTPKYINTPESPAYNKTEALYGLYQAHHARDTNWFLVEGYTDVLRLYQNDRVGVATMGTAITPRHIQRIAGMTDSITLAFDPDEAGQKAMGEAAQDLYRMGLNPSVLDVDQDPDDAFQESIDVEKHTISLWNYMREVIRTRVDMNTVAGKKRLLDTMQPIVSAVSDPVLETSMVQTLSEDLNVDASVLREPNESRNQPLRQLKQSGGYRALMHLLHSLKNYPEQIAPVRDDLYGSDFPDGDVQTIVRSLRNHLEENGQFEPSGWVNNLDGEIKKRVTDGLAARTMDHVAGRMTPEQIVQKIKQFDSADHQLTELTRALSDVQSPEDDSLSAEEETLLREVVDQKTQSVGGS